MLNFDWSGIGEAIGYIGVIGGLIFSAIAALQNAEALKLDVAARRTENQLRLKKEHREIWSLPLFVPELERVERKDVDVAINPVTSKEKFFVGLVLQQISTSLDSAERDVFDLPEETKADVREFFSLPIPRAAWIDLENLQNARLRAFIGDCLK